MADTGFITRSVQLRGTEYLYQVYVPVEYTPERAWSVILFLHGSDESGEDGTAQTQVGLGPAIRSNPERFPTIVVFPQAREGKGWRGEMAEQALLALDQTIHEYNTDADRIYLTGVSMGGYGSWYLAQLSPDRFAALAPVCGGLDTPPPHPRDGQPASETRQKRDFAEAARRLKHIPAWVFHGAEDEIVPVSESRAVVNALKDAGGDVRYTEYPGVKHNSWELAYGDPQLITWMLSQSRNAEARLREESEAEIMG